MNKYPDLKAYIDAHYIPPLTSPQPAMFACPAQAQVAGHAFDGESSEKSSKKSLFGIKKAKSSLRSSKHAEVLECQEEATCMVEPALQSYDELIDELKEKLDERQKHLADSFSEYLLHLIELKGLNNVDVYKEALVDKKLFAKIKNDLDYHPNKLTCLCLCVGARCNLDEARDLLSRAGYAFSPSDMRDVIFQYFIEKGIYDMIEIDLQLEEYGVPGIIA